MAKNGYQTLEVERRPDGVVIVFPERQDLAGVRERAEQRFVQQLIPQAAIEAFDEGILLRLAGCNVVPLDLAVLRPAQYCHAGELGAVVRNDHCRTTANGDHSIEFARDPQVCGDAQLPAVRKRLLAWGYFQELR